MRMIAVFIAGLIVGLCAPVCAQGVDPVLDGIYKMIFQLQKDIKVTDERLTGMIKADRKNYSDILDMQTQITGEQRTIFKNVLGAIDRLDKIDALLIGTDTKTLNRVAELERRYSKLEQEVKNRPIAPAPPVEGKDYAALEKRLAAELAEGLKKSSSALDKPVVTYNDPTLTFSMVYKSIERLDRRDIQLDNRLKVIEQAIRSQPKILMLQGEKL